MIKYSIITPVYNTHSELNSIIIWFEKVNINRTDLELIIIDDGSDHRLNIGVSNNVKYFYKDNGGVSTARNFGIEKSSGQYILFLDSDDSYNEKLFDVLDAEFTNNIDVCVFGYQRVTSVDCRVKSNLAGFYNNITFIRQYSTKKINLHLGSCVFRRDIIHTNNISFNEEISHGEDILFIFSVLFVSTKFQVIDKLLLSYNYRPGSAVNITFSKNAISNFYALNLIKSGSNSTNEAYVNFYLITCYINLMLNLVKNKTNSKDVIDVFVKEKEFLKLNSIFVFSIPGVIVFLFKLIRYTNDAFLSSVLKWCALKCDV